MTAYQQIVETKSSEFFNGLSIITTHSRCDDVRMVVENKNGGPNHLQAWREYRGITQTRLAELVESSPQVISYLESGRTQLSAKWLRVLAPALDTTPGMLLDHDPNELDNDIIDIWTHMDKRAKRQLTVIGKELTGTND